MNEKRVIIMGAGGRDFHNFNVYFRNNSDYRVVAFTAGQIPNIANRVYPPSLAGPNYPEGIPIFPEEVLSELIAKFGVDEVVLSYSDLNSQDFIEKMSRVLVSGASFKILSPRDTMLESPVPVIAVCASRTGAGKSTVSRYISRAFKRLGIRFVVVRHPMVYGKFDYPVQRFKTYEDLEKYNCTIEEREEYEWHIKEGNTVYAGVDYEKVLEAAVREADVILWDGGNNDWPFFKPTIMITVVDPLRPGQEISSYPGLVNTMMADIIVINKANTATKEQIKIAEENVRKVNRHAKIIRTASEISVDAPDLIKGKRVLVVEDGPTITHGHLSYGAGYLAAKMYGARDIVDPRPYALGSILEAYREYSHMGPVLPALGYGQRQMKELEEVINRTPADTVVLGTPSDISRYLKVNKPVVHVKYELRDLANPTLEEILVEMMRAKDIL